MKPITIWDDRGAICKLDDDLPGVLLDAVTGRKIRRATKKWQRAVERLTDLTGWHA